MDQQTLNMLMEECGAGRRKLIDPFFTERPPARLGIYDIDNEDIFHTIVETICPVPGCNVISYNLLESESHYETAHRFICSKCKKGLPTAHLLDLHLQEYHDSFFAVMALKKASYACYVEECKEKFMTPDERFNHGVTEHKLPEDFRFDIKQPEKLKKKETNKKQGNRRFSFHNSSKLMFKKIFSSFTGDSQPSTSSVDMDEVMADLRDSLPNPDEKS